MTENVKAPSFSASNNAHKTGATGDRDRDRSVSPGGLSLGKDRDRDSQVASPDNGSVSDSNDQVSVSSTANNMDSNRDRGMFEEDFDGMSIKKQYSAGGGEFRVGSWCVGYSVLPELCIINCIRCIVCIGLF